jgi:nucleoside-triphosphatase THEP1
MKKALSKLWDLYSETKAGRVNDALDYCEKKFKYLDEIGKLQKDLRNSQDEVKKVVEEKQMLLALKAQAEQGMLDARAELKQKKVDDDTCNNMHKCLRIKAEKDRQVLKEDKRKLEFIIADFLKQKEATRARFNRIKDICNEPF